MVRRVTLAAVIIAACMYPGPGCSRQQRLPHVDLAEANSVGSWAGSVPCHGKEYCLYVYLASWCRACRETVPFVHDLRAYYRNSDLVGITVIVGQDRGPAMQQFAAGVGEMVYIDDGRFADAAHVRAYPTWILVARGDSIICKKGAGGIRGGNQEGRVRYFFEESLGVDWSRFA
ncbi:MAG: hypothetical protein GF418_17125, partial [Chitinivibrionales bacterium]|nr:hypothetical protein [Chitinivibrionales bacterium]MBD3397342.1 hypothetical protein [Chitinivibrionales bacterium]